MDLRRLRHAEALARHLSFTKAAHELNLTQSALSRSIQGLEDECQLRLFDRNRNVVEITPVGQEFVRHARILLRKEAELMEMVSNAAGGDGGSIALGMAPLASRTLLAPLMAEMITKPGFHASVTIGGPKKLLQMLLDESVHICVCTGRVPLSHPSFASVPLAQFPISLVIRANHPLAQLATVTPDDLNRYPVLHTRSFGGDEDGAVPEDEGLQRAPVLAIEDYDILARITSNSDAVWVTSPISAKDWLDSGMLIQLPIKWLAQAPSGHMTAYYLKNRTLSPTAQRIIERLVSLGKEIFCEQPIEPAINSRHTIEPELVLQVLRSQDYNCAERAETSR